MEEEDEIHQGGQLCKFPRLENTEELEDGGGGGGGFNSNNWHHSSRIIRVSRASGGKDRHSKVMTSKGLRDRRVRLSVTTAIQFYDLQDRLGYDQPSKAVEWLIKSASDAISELPSLNTTFPDTPKQPSDEKRGFDSADAEVVENDQNMIINHQQNQNQNQNVCLSKSGCSSNNSETSKGSGLTLARTDIRVNRVKARERARERTAKEKEVKEVVVASQSHGNNSNNIAHQTASFTELLTGGMNNTNSTPRGSVSGHHQIQGDEEARQQWSSTPMDYFSPMLLGTSSRMSPLLSQNIQLGHSHSVSEHHQTMSVSPFNNYSFTPHDHVMAAASSNEYNLNFTISSSSGLAGYNRGTLQSNSLSLLPHLQRFSSLDHHGSSSSSSSSSSSTLPFFMGHGIAAAQPPPAAPSTNTMENNQHHHHQFSSPFDANRLHLCYGDACRHSDQKGKPKN